MTPSPEKDPMEEFLAREKAALEALELQDPSSPVGTSSPAERKGSLVSSGVASPASQTMSSAVSQTHSVTYSNAPSAKTPVSPHSPSTRGPMEETPSMQAARTERLQRMAERDAAAAKTGLERRARAKTDLDAFRAEWKETVAGRRQTNRSRKETTGSPWDDEKPAGAITKEHLDWEKVAGLIETLPKPTKDTSRLVGIISSLVGADKKQ